MDLIWRASEPGRRCIGSVFAQHKDEKEEHTEHKARGGDAKTHEHDKASHDVVMQVLKDDLSTSRMRVSHHRVLGDEILKSLIVCGRSAPTLPEAIRKGGGEAHHLI